MIFKCGDTVKATHDACKGWPSCSPYEHLKVISVSKHCLVAANSAGNTFVGGPGCFELVKKAGSNE